MDFFSRGGRNRTHVKGFGDLRSTVKLHPYLDIQKDDLALLPRQRGLL